MAGELMPTGQTGALEKSTYNPTFAMRYGEAVAIATACALCALCALVLTAPALSLLFVMAQLVFFATLTIHIRRHDEAIERHLSHLSSLSS